MISLNPEESFWWNGGRQEQVGRRSIKSTLLQNCSKLGLPSSPQRFRGNFTSFFQCSYFCIYVLIYFFIYFNLFSVRVKGMMAMLLFWEKPRTRTKMFKIILQHSSLFYLKKWKLKSCKGKKMMKKKVRLLVLVIYIPNPTLLIYLRFYQEKGHFIDPCA